jgi:DNA-directed RNA polymerase subunit RPC12/RpoP
MKKLMEVKIKDMFTAFESYFDREQAQYFCNHCNQRFATNWAIAVSPYNPWVGRGAFVRCPYCGSLHDKYIGKGRPNEYIPYKATLKVVGMKRAIYLRIDYEALAFKKEIFKTRWQKGTEVFRFDLDKGATFAVSTINNKKQVEVANYPINFDYATAILSGSVLRYFRSDSLANKNYRPDLTKLLKALREYIDKIMKRERNVDIGKTYINALGHQTGMFLYPLINLAYRMDNPDKDNIKVDTDFKSPVNKIYTVPNDTYINVDWLQRVFDKMITEKVDINTAMIFTAELPNKDAVRKIVMNDYHNITNLKESLSTCKNFDLAIRLYNAIKVTKEIKEFFAEIIIPLYEEAGAVMFAENAEKYNLKDCIRLYNQLNDENKANFKTEKIRQREMHDWLMLTHRTQTHVNMNLNVPEHVVKRLSMQTDKLKFFVPQESIELLETGCKLNNCVAGYSSRMAEGTLYIVVVTDDKGKYQACLEIKDNKIVQAKINRNKPVHLDTKINQTVIKWAKERKLIISTKDVNEQRKNIDVSHAV